MFYKCEYLHTDNVDYICPTKVGEELNEKLKKLAIETYQAVECRDFGRIDMRVDNEQNLYVLEVNPLPSLMKIDTFGVIGDYLGVGYDRLIQDIFDAAVERYGL
jgi:D-alanine-D-alanine ligase